jgi:pyruvate/2-oxoglutarate dehydrogenase complex dihydrolipoamide acyltransferase (E2) component
VGLLKRLDAVGLAPRALLDSDPMYASAFVANLGSIKIDAAYHHLYEHGNCPLFVAVGQVQRTPHVDDDGAVQVRPSVTVRYTYDERIEDGLYCAAALDLLRRRVEDPVAWLGAA